MPDFCSEARKAGFCRIFAVRPRRNVQGTGRVPGGYPGVPPQFAFSRKTPHTEPPKKLASSSARPATALRDNIAYCTSPSSAGQPDQAAGCGRPRTGRTGTARRSGRSGRSRSRRTWRNRPCRVGGIKMNDAFFSRGRVENKLRKNVEKN